MRTTVLLFHLLLLLGCGAWCVRSNDLVVSLIYPKLHGTQSEREQLLMIDRLNQYGWDSIASAVATVEHPSAGALPVSDSKSAKDRALSYREPSSVSSHLTLRKALALLFSPPTRRASELLNAFYALDSMLLTNMTGNGWPTSFTNAGYYSRHCVLETLFGIERWVHQLTVASRLAMSVNFVQPSRDHGAGLGSVLHVLSAYMAQALDKNALLLFADFGRLWLKSDHFATICPLENLLCLFCPSEYFFLLQNNSTLVAKPDGGQVQSKVRTVSGSVVPSNRTVGHASETSLAAEDGPIHESARLSDKVNAHILKMSAYGAPHLVSNTCLAKVDSTKQFWRSVALFYTLRPTASLARRMAPFFTKNLLALEQLQPCVAVFCRRGDKLMEDRWDKYRLPDGLDYWHQYVERMGNLPLSRWKNVFLTTDSTAVVNQWTELWEKKFSGVSRPPRLVLLDTQREPAEWLTKHRGDPTAEYHLNHKTVVDAHDTGRILAAKTVSLLCDDLYSTQASNSLRLIDELRRVLHPWRSVKFPHNDSIPQTFFDVTEPPFPRDKIW
eukprot:CAMPEP_0177659902 /NCGR_PEP_ID=MMETSP0447-20121125/17705_1 /TAXON_ID=0 /ORGANISM="Stygamoeba regulata, Strain BSH-02190019" /LENGTH=554 /DNA_ID=CAMNT_0019164833 /DNA_START=36 /DNA_END=1700 /DNA_ORIENTATION=+